MRWMRARVRLWSRSKSGGKRLIRVSDDGAGIPADEAALAFARHSTSKLETVEDLNQIRTLGFRGEALASIAAVSRITLITRHRAAKTPASRSRSKAANCATNARRVRRWGRWCTVENLFFNTPARLKFLKAESTERRHITQLVTRYAMAYPDVRFRLVQERLEQFHSTGSGDLADVLVEAFGLDTFREMLEVSPLPPARPDLPPIEVYGFTSAPSVNRSNRGHIVLFVNGRAIVDQSLTYAVVQAYHTLLPVGRLSGGGAADHAAAGRSGCECASDQSRSALSCAGCRVFCRAARRAAGGRRSGPGAGYGRRNDPATARRGAGSPRRRAT